MASNFATRLIRAKFYMDFREWKNEIPDWTESTQYGDLETSLIEVYEMIDETIDLWNRMFHIALDYEVRIHTDDEMKPKLCEVRFFRSY